MSCSTPGRTLVGKPVEMALFIAPDDLGTVSKQRFGPWATVLGHERLEQMVWHAQGLHQHQLGIGLAHFRQDIECAGSRLNHAASKLQQARHHGLFIVLLKQHDAFFQRLQSCAVFVGRITRFGVQREVDHRGGHVHQRLG